MDPSTAERLRSAASTLGDLIALAQGNGLKQTAQLLTAARLNLLMDIHDISDLELREICAALESGNGSEKPVAPAGKDGPDDLPRDRQTPAPINFIAARLRRPRAK